MPRLIVAGLLAISLSACGPARPRPVATNEHAPAPDARIVGTGLPAIGPQGEIVVGSRDGTIYAFR